MLKKYFFRRLKTNFFIMIIPTFVIFLIIGSFLLYSQTSSIETESRNALVSFEESLESSLYNVGSQLDTMMSSPTYTLVLRRLLDHTWLEKEDQIVFNMLKFFFYSYKNSYSYIHSIYLYLDGRERFLTSATGQLASIETYYDTAWLEEFRAMDPDVTLFTSRRTIRPNSYDPVEVLGLYYRLTYLDGVIVININKRKYEDILRHTMRTDRQKVFLANSRGEIVATTDQEEDWPLDEMTLRDIFPEDPEKTTECWGRLNGKWQYFCLNYSEYMNLYQVSAISVWQILGEIYFYLLIAALVLLIETAAVILTAYFYTRRSFQYIEQCLDIFAAAERGEWSEQKVLDEKDEYGMILNNIIYMHLKNNQIQMQLKEQQYENEITEMAALQLQINPHFIFNTLQIMDFEAIRSLGPGSMIHEMLQQLSKVVKYALTDPTGTVPLSQELEYLRAYLEIQKIRFQDAGITYFEIDDSILDEHVFRLLLQPMLENCFTHGLDPEHSRIVIKVKIYDREDYVSFAVIDNGKGLTKTEIAELYRKINDPGSRNIGLTNLNRRLLLHYGEESRLVIRSKKDMGTIVQFRISKAKLAEDSKKREEK